VKIAFVTDNIGGTIGSLIDGPIGSTQRRQDDELQRRRGAAAELFAWMVPMVEQLHHLRDRRVTMFWVEHIPAADRSLDAMKVRLPGQWRHLNRSTRAYLDEALGNGFVFLDTGDDVLGDTIDYAPGGRATPPTTSHCACSGSASGRTSGLHPQYSGL
jgi:hypothetical protein